MPPIDPADLIKRCTIPKTPLGTASFRGVYRFPADLRTRNVEREGTGAFVLVASSRSAPLATKTADEVVISFLAIKTC